MRKSTLLVALSFAAVGCNRAKADPQPTPQPAPMAASAPTAAVTDQAKQGMDDVQHKASDLGQQAKEGAQAAKDSFTTTGVLQKIHDINQHEIAMGTMAKDQATNSKVKSYAEQMVKDHTKADEKVTELAKKDQLTMEAAPPDESMMTDMKSKKGADFDKAFMTAMVDGHKDALDFLEKARTKVSDKGVKDLVAKLTPTIQDHLKKGEALQKKLEVPRMGRNK